MRNTSQPVSRVRMRLGLSRLLTANRTNLPGTGHLQGDGPADGEERITRVGLVGCEAQNRTLRLTREVRPPGNRGRRDYRMVRLHTPRLAGHPGGLDVMGGIPEFGVVGHDRRRIRGCGRPALCARSKWIHRSANTARPQVCTAAMRSSGDSRLKGSDPSKHGARYSSRGDRPAPASDEQAWCLAGGERRRGWDISG